MPNKTAAPTFKTTLQALSKIDWPLLIIVAALILIGMIMVFSTTSITGLNDYNDPYFFIKKQMVFLLLGCIMLVLGLLIPNQLYQRHALSGFIITSAILALTLIPGIGITSGGATRWVSLAGFQFQPVELMKFWISVFLATAIANKSAVMGDFKKGIVPILSIMLVPVLILGLQPDLGNTILIAMVTMTMLYLGGMRYTQLLALASFAISLVSISILTHPYQLQRITSFLNPWEDPLGKNYHVIQSFIAIGSGGIFGHGFGQSKLKFFYLPLHYSDFVFSVICEEGGLIFASIVLGLFAALFFRVVKIANKAKNAFASFLALALLLFLFIQAMVNIGVVIGVFPVTGIPLTFISYGGTSFIMSMFFVGVILNISKGDS